MSLPLFVVGVTLFVVSVVGRAVLIWRYGKPRPPWER